MNRQASLYVGSATARMGKWLTVAFCAGLLVLSTSCTKLQSRDQMNQGVQAYKNGKYQDAVKHFKEAVRLDPTNENAKLYLATSYYTQWVPGAESADNKKNLDMARQTFEDVLKNDPNNSLALATMSAMSFNLATAKTNDAEKAAALEDTKKWNERRIQADPKDAEAYYYLGVIDFIKVNPSISAARVDEKIPADNPGPIKKASVREQLKERDNALIEDGIQQLHKSLDVNPENEDAMDYLSLLLRDKAALEDTPDQAQADWTKANNWFNKSLETKKIKASRPKKTEES